MTRQASIQITEATDRQIRELAVKWELPPERNLSQVVRKAVEEAYRRETERRKTGK